MATTISKGRLFRVTVSVNDDLIKAMRNSPELMMKAVEAGADYWHTGILPKHFDDDAHSRYGYAKRARDYLKKKGGKPDLVFSGSMRSDVCSKAQFRLSGKVVELRLTARVLNFIPRMQENSPDLYVTHTSRKRHITKTYPNMKRELKVVTDDEREAIAKVVSSEFTLTLEKLQRSN